MTCTSLVLSMGGVTYAAIGGAFVLGSGNSAGAPTSLTSKTTSGSTLVVTNKGRQAAATFKSQDGVAPFAVNRDTRVDRLNADLLDGLDASSFVRADQHVPAAYVHNSGEQTAPNLTIHDLVASAEVFDHGDLWDGSADAGAFTVSEPGTYVISATVNWQANSNGYRRVDLQTRDGGIGTAVGPANGSPAFTVQNVSGIAYFDAGDTVRVTAVQGSGGPLKVRLMAFQIAYVGR